MPQVGFNENGPTSDLPEGKTLKRQDLRQYLFDKLLSARLLYFGDNNRSWIDRATNNWLNDKLDYVQRHEDMYNVFGQDEVKRARILDMASGCGTFVFNGLLNGIDVWGVEPEDWKNNFNCLKADVYGYPSAWKRRFIKAVGEALPFKNESFDFVCSHQTLEHVQNVELCLKEMIRVSKKAVFIRAPDYTGTFEGHYRLPWLPLFPRSLAKLYLRLLKRPTLGLDTINYVTLHSIKHFLKKYRVTIVDLRSLDHYANLIKDRLHLRRFGYLGVLLSHVGGYCYRNFFFLKTLFRHEKSINIVIIKDGRTIGT